MCNLNAQYYYIATNDVSNLYFENKGEIKLGISLPLEGQNNVQLGYSPIKHFNISTAFHRYNDKNYHLRIGQIKTINSSFILSGGSYLSFKNPFKSGFFVFKNLKHILFQGNIGYSFNKNNNIFAYDSPHHIEINSQGVFFRVSCFIKYRRLSFGISRQLTFVNIKKAVIIGDHLKNPVGIDRFKNMIGSTGRQKLRDYTLSIRYKIMEVEAFFTVHSIDNPKYSSRIPFYEQAYTNIGVVLPIDLLFKPKKKELP